MPERPRSPSSSSRSSATPPPQVVEKKKKKKSDSKDRSKKQVSADGSGKNEGVDPNWDYKPLPGATLVEEDDGLDAGEFDWDTIEESDDLELWLIRIPDSVKSKYLDGLKVDVPSSSRSGRIGELTRKHATFDIWSIGDDDAPVGGEEIKSISCLLPRKSKKGRLYPAPKPIARHIIFSAQEVKPTPDPEADSATPYKNPPRHSYPKEVLKHRFIPFGASSKNNDEVDSQEEEEPSKMDVDDHPPPGQPPKSSRKKRSKKADENETAAEPEPQVAEKKSKGKKRKGESTEAEDTPAPKKPKKSKAV